EGVRRRLCRDRADRVRGAQPARARGTRLRAAQAAVDREGGAREEHLQGLLHPVRLVAQRSDRQRRPLTALDLQLTDKIAIVTGSSKGLGFATADALVQEGCRVTICARGEARLHEAAAELRARASSADHVLAVQTDLATAEGVERVVAET